MTERREPHGSVPFSEAACLAMRAKCDSWTSAQAARLDTTPDVILEAIRERVWLPEQIEQVTSR